MRKNEKANAGNVLFKLLLFCSAATLMALYLSLDAESVLAAVVFGLLLLAVIIRLPLSWREIKPLIKKRYVVIGFAIGIAGLGRFLLPSRIAGKAQLFREAFGMDGDLFALLMTVLGVLLLIASVPFIPCAMAYLCRGAETAQNADAFLKGKFFYRFCVAASAFILLLAIAFSFSLDLWGDEMFSLELCQHSYGEIVSLTARDVHPPLYYFILKFFLDAVHLILPNVSTVYIGKLVSVFPMILIFIMMTTVVKKRWGTYVAGFGALCMIGMPNMLYFSVNIRMYSWAAFFVFMAFLAFAELLKKDSVKNWALLIFWSLAAAYTQYFACLAVASLYFVLLIHFIWKARGRLKCWFAASVLTVLGYLPWITVLLQQLHTVSEGYWILDLEAFSFVLQLRYLFGSILLFLLCATVAVLCFGKLIRKMDTAGTDEVALAAIFVPLFVMLTGDVVSLVFRPVFVERYLIPGVPCLWLGVGLALLLSNRKTLRVYTTVLALVLCVINTAVFGVEEAQAFAGSREARAFLEEHREATFVSPNSYQFYTSIMLSDDDLDCYCLNVEDANQFNFSLLSDVIGEELNRLKPIVDSDFRRIVEENEEVYFLDLYGESGIPDGLLESNGLELSYVGTYRLDLNVDVYRVRVKTE